MRALVLVLGAGGLAFACGPSTPSPAKPPPAPPVPLEEQTRTCTDAAAGIERATKDLRPPEHQVLGAMQRRCAEDHWTAITIDCFAGMTDDGLTTCARHLPEAQRATFLADVLGTQANDDELTEIVTKLTALKVGILNCDRFVAAVTRVMTCPGITVEERVQLGTETADFWSLPTGGLRIEAQAKMAAACGESLKALQQQATDVGCMP